MKFEKKKKKKNSATPKVPGNMQSDSARLLVQQTVNPQPDATVSCLMSAQNRRARSLRGEGGGRGGRDRAGGGGGGRVKRGTLAREQGLRALVIGCHQDG